MNYKHLTLLAMTATLAACSAKTDTPAAPATQASQPAATATPAPAAAEPAAPASPAGAGAVAAAARKVTLDCDDRTVVLEATCSADADASTVDCSEQSLAMADRATGTVRSTHRFDNKPETPGDPPLVDARVGALACVRSKDNVRHVVADLFNGGNCEACEWHELYDWDGHLVGSDRDRRKPDATLKAVRDDMAAPGNVIAQKDTVEFYKARPDKP
jgi:hypothetical protein